jgi:hypothetical protein
MTSIYLGGFSIEDVNSIGKSFVTTCKASSGYNLTEGKTYKVTVTVPIMPMNPLCKVIDDMGKWVECHLERFEKQ